MAINTITKPTPYMKSLTQNEYSSILSDVNSLIARGNEALTELSEIINRDSNREFKLAFNTSSDKRNGSFFVYNNIKEGYSSFNSQLSPGSRTTVDQITSLYKR
jgi:hypothetical protein